MSLSAPDNNGSYSRIPHSGKTPPPAPSAAYAKRARELQASESLGNGARYRPPALRALASGGSPPNEGPPSVVSPTEGGPLPPSNYPPGFRRARAGTLPSNVQLAAQRFAAASTNLSPSPSSESLLDQQTMPPSAPNPASAFGPTRPGLRHSASIAGPVASAASERNSRLRSGSLTLPSRGLSNAFPSILSSSWLPSAGGTGFATLDELHSVTSGESQSGDFDVHTLDYLGLDDAYLMHDGHRLPPPAATISELRNQMQATLAGNLTTNPSRLRASTVSNPYRARPSASSLMPTPAAEEEEEYFDEYNDRHTSYSRQRLNSYEASGTDAYSQYIAQSFKPTEHLAPARPRAISVGNLDEPMRTITRRATTADLHPYLGNLDSQPPPMPVPQNIPPAIPSPASILKEKLTARGGTSPNVHFPNGEQPRGSSYLVAPGGQTRSVSPKSEGPASQQIQTPTRSLWIGNLDSAVTSEQLIHHFAPYGAIESLRLLPEKECGFVNFVDQADAIRAKEDVLNRLGGNIGMPNGQTVRIGFGKADSAPVAPAKGNPTSPGPIAASAPKSATGAPGMSGIESQLQSTPTRALWIGSIPSTTTPATILSVFSPYGPIESARVLTHKNCGFVNFERLDDAVRARKALNGRDVLGSDVGAIRIGFAKVPVKNSTEGGEENAPVTSVTGVGDLSVGATIQALRNVKGASTIPSDQQVLSGMVENYRSNLLLSMISSGKHNFPADVGSMLPGWAAALTEQQMIMRELSGGDPEAEQEIIALADFRPPTMYYTVIPSVSERSHNRRWDAAKLRELRKRLDSGTMSPEDIDSVASEFIEGEIVDLASDWLGNTVVQKLFEKCSAVPRLAMLERLAPHLAMIGIHKNGTWAAQKVIECVQTTEEISLVAQNLRPYAPPLLLDQFGNYVVQCCLRFGSPNNDFIFDAMVDRMWEVAQGRFGARSMRACLESPHITRNQQRRVGTAIILNSIPLATNPNGALLLTWLLDTSEFPSRYELLAPRFTPHLSHLCTHKLASLTVLRIVNQKHEPEASFQIVDALFNSPGDHVLTDVLGDQVNGVSVVHKILTSSFIAPDNKAKYIEATKRVLIELKVIATQAYRRLIEEVGLPVPNFQPTYNNLPPGSGGGGGGKSKGSQSNTYSVPGLPNTYASNDQGLAAMMASLQMGGQNAQAGPPQLQVDPGYNNPTPPRRTPSYSPSPAADPYSPAYSGGRNSEAQTPRGGGMRRHPSLPSMTPPYGSQSPAMTPSNSMGGVAPQPTYATGPMTPQSMQNMPPQLYQYMYHQGYPQSPNMGTFHA